MQASRPQERLLAVSFLAFGLLFLSWSVLRYRRFSPDSMNYVNVAHNLLRGRGLTQDTIGYGGNYLRADLPSGDPLGTHPPLYPVAVAGVAALGVPVSDAALLVAGLGYLAVLSLGAWLARKIIDERAGLWALGLLMLSYPLRLVGQTAWAETSGLALFLGSLITIVPRPEPEQRLRLFLSGALAGLAFGARYPLVVALPIGVAALFEPKSVRRSIQRTWPFLVGFAVIFTPIVWRNVAELGYWTGVSRNPSTLSLADNLRAASEVLFQQYGAAPTSRRTANAELRLKEHAQLLLLVVTFAIALFRLARNGRCRLAVAGQRWLLPFACCAYAGVLVVQRTLQNFDPINGRLISPSNLFLMLTWAGLMATAFAAASAAFLRSAILVVLVVEAYPLSRDLAYGTRAPEAKAVRQSELLTWVRDATAREDLLIAEDGQRVPFFLDRPVIYLTSFPQMNYVTRTQVCQLLARACPRSRNVYLLLNDHRWSDYDWRTLFGPLVADIAAKRPVRDLVVETAADLDDGRRSSWAALPAASSPHASVTSQLGKAARCGRWRYAKRRREIRVPSCEDHGVRGELSARGPMATAADCNAR